LATPIRLPITEQRQVLLPPLEAGGYVLDKVRSASAPAGIAGQGRYISVNPDPRESDMRRIDQAALQELFGPSLKVVGDEGEAAAALTPTGWSFWPLAVILLLAAYVAEGFIGWLSSARRERVRAAENGGRSCSTASPNLGARVSSPASPETAGQKARATKGGGAP
jgi:hypothetical protein